MVSKSSPRYGHGGQSKPPGDFRSTNQQLSQAELTSMLVRLFEFAPIAMSITTSDTRTSSYVKVNDAYLQLIGRSWEEIRGKQLVDAAAIDNPARDRRHQLLLDNGSYELEEVDIAHADGTIIPTLISAQRTVIGDVSYDVEVILDVSSRVRQQQEIENALIASARTDALSGLPNRAAFDITLSEMISRNLDGSRKLAIAYIDLNGFKGINDTLGHDAGDHVLKTVAARLRQNFRATDFIARIGGDEFAVLLEMDRNFASGIYTHISNAMQKVFKPISVDGQLTRAGAAVGATFLSHDDTVQSYLKRADQFMYQAKATRERIAVVCAV